MDNIDYFLIAKGINQGSALVAAHPKNIIPKSLIRKALTDTFIVQLEKKLEFNEQKFRATCEYVNKK